VDDLLCVDAAVERPRRLEVLLHALLERPRNVVCAKEVFEVSGLGLVDRSPSVHSLDDCRHVSKHQRVHQRCSHRHNMVIQKRQTPLNYHEIRIKIDQRDRIFVVKIAQV